jgi:hypothetical protein
LVNRPLERSYKNLKFGVKKSLVAPNIAEDGKGIKSMVLRGRDSLVVLSFAVVGFEGIGDVVKGDVDLGGTTASRVGG